MSTVTLARTGASGVETYLLDNMSGCGNLGVQLVVQLVKDAAETVCPDARFVRYMKEYRKVLVIEEVNVIGLLGAEYTGYRVSTE